ncbi:hypothetical protein RM553_15295 [Zunongwangia sp. F363]|uniref:Uncharacterized protein n=1 Tax=Autumnicola tepida TaxID=3075595 RepID=A0ABU3CD00_9FLAO|nr:hypothetical protein [Zunongwangia sp. F363]MDT0644201.1 hypothetical protein [Zunongwangia sp. F363]
MKRIEPFKTNDDALVSLDNGGRFFNLFTKADDGIITQAELGKVGGIFNDKQNMVLFLEMAISRLSSDEQETLISKLDKELKTTYFKFKPQRLLPSEVAKKGKISSNAILTGVPKLIEGKSAFNGFIMMPIMAGKTMTFMMIPLIEKYNVYELRDETTSETFIIAHSKDSEILPQEKIVIAGVIKELQAQKGENAPAKFLEAIYHTSADGL